MALLSKGIANLIGGVSQQPDAVRFDNQCDAMDNAFPSVLEGLTKRMPTEHVANLDSATPGADEDYFVHLINRDPSERYVVTVKSDESAATIKVHTLDGTAKTVDTPDGTGYLQMPSATKYAETQLRAITIADYTFIVNRTKTVAMAADTDAGRNPEAIFFVKQGDYGSSYTAEVTFGGTTYTTKVTTPNGGSASHRLDIATDVIVKAMVDGAAPGSGAGKDLTVTETNGGINGISGVTLSQSGSVLWVKSDDTTDFTVDGTDGLGETGMEIIKDEVQHLTDLPTSAPHDFRVKIVGDATDTRDDYYVKFVADDGVFGTGHWQEFRGAKDVDGNAIKYKLDPTTMAHVLVRKSDGNFVFGAVDGGQTELPLWGERNAGDDVSNSDPTFVGKAINDIFLFKNRLGFLADENVVLSETSEFFNFWRTTVTDILDTDVIDVASTHSSVSILTSAIPVSNQLVLFSEQTQFILHSGVPLSTQTVSMTKTTNYESVSDVRPVTLGSSIYFGFTRGAYTGIRQYYVVEDATTLFEAADISAQVPQYLDGNLRDMAGSSHEDILFALVDGDRSVLYAYKFFDDSQERLQSAWSRFKFSSNTTILGMEFIDTTLYLVVKRADGIFLDKMRMESGLVDAPKSYRTLLDRRVDQSACTLSGDGLTITMPYKAYTGTTMEVITKDGARIPVTTQTNDSNQLVMSSSLTGVDFWLGEAYEMLYQFSDVVLREPSTAGGTSPVAEARVQVRYVTLSYSNTGFFKVEVTPDYRDTSTHPFTGRILGSGGNLIGSVPLESGDFRVPVYSKNNQVTISCKNDTPLPCALTSAEFEMSVNSRSERYG
tara:strand:- start:533 stop:3022 length:2490 start_codon:yes stop_codon:yes gene_type:complete